MATIAPINLVVITPRANLPVSLADAKGYLRVDHTADDALIASLIGAATDMVERATHRVLVRQTYRWTLADFPSMRFRGDTMAPLELPRSPAVEITAGGSYAYSMPRVQYFDTNGVLRTAVKDVDYELDLGTNPPSLQLPPASFWPLTQPGKAKRVFIDFVAGYSDTSAGVPELLRQAVLMLVAHWYEHREAVGQCGAEVPLAVDSIMKIYSDGGM
jgi:uncharacterized phiE125 gp8 family phage protein